MRLIIGVSDTRSNQEDFAITPYLFGVWMFGKIVRVCGIGMCWGWWSIHVSVGINIPKDYPTFKIIR